jgi:[acyl-carrier-protein] S-malonyltransferase
MDKKTAFLFPGQGSQSVGMASAIAEASPVVRQTFAEASGVLGYDLWEVVENGPAETLGRTEVTQPALLAAGVATWRAWKALAGVDPDFVAGHSLGEYTALVAAGALAFGDAVSLVAQRGRLMQQATPDGTGAMAAILGLEDAALAEVCAQAAQGQVVSCANFNSPGQVVIAGEKEAVDRACDLAKAAGARRAVPLAVSVPSHCLLMKPAAEALAELLRDTAIETPAIPVLHNVNASPAGDGPAIREALMQQLWQPVRWSETIQRLVDDGVERFAECGPGKVLAGLNRRICRDCETAAWVDAPALRNSLDNWN